MTWPYPGDPPVLVARRVAWAYRQRLDQVAPSMCTELDRIMSKLGQHWVIPQPLTRRPDEWVPARDAAALAGLSLSTLSGLRRAGRITGRQKSARHWEYQVADVYALSANPRTRNGTP